MMKTFILSLIAISLTGCAYHEGQRVLNDPDCTFVGKPAEWRWPKKCGTIGGGTAVYVRQIGPNTYYISK